MEINKKMTKINNGKRPGGTDKEEKRKYKKQVRKKKSFLKGSLILKKLSWPVKELHLSVTWVPSGRSKSPDNCARFFIQCAK